MWLHRLWTLLKMESFLWNLSWELEKILSLSVFENKLDKLLVGMICAALVSWGRRGKLICLIPILQENFNRQISRSKSCVLWSHIHMYNYIRKGRKIGHCLLKWVNEFSISYLALSNLVFFFFFQLTVKWCFEYIFIKTGSFRCPQNKYESKQKFWRSALWTGPLTSFWSPCIL